MPEEDAERIAESAGQIPSMKSKNRKEIEAMLERIGITLDSRINVVDLESGERHFFDDYTQALEFMKGKKGRWYVTTPGVRYDKDKIAELR
jgi:hypothetical protein